MNKKILTVKIMLFITLMTAVGIFALGKPISVHASSQVAYSVKGGRIWFKPKTGEITWADKGVKEAKIPSSIRGKKVKAIKRYAFYQASNLKKVTLPKSLKRIDEGAFYGCTKLTSINIPKSVKYIGKYAFRGCEWALTPDYSDSYKNSIYYQQLKETVMTGNYRDDIIAIARSQIGYCESDSEDSLDGSSAGSGDYTEYGRALDSNGSAWCSEFACWCIRQAGVPSSVIKSSRSASVKEFDAPYYLWSQTIYGGGSYRPQKGDLVLFSWGNTSIHDDYLSHTAIFESEELDGDQILINVIHGNCNNDVRESTYTADAGTGRLLKKTGYVACFVAPSYGKSIKKKTLKFNANGGACSVSSRKVAQKASYGNLPQPVRNGYTFTGWYTKKKGGTLISAYKPVDISKTTKVYAHWKMLP